MGNYRLYLLDGDKDVIRMIEIVHLDDEQAPDKAKGLPIKGATRLELWQGGRLVAGCDS